MLETEAAGTQRPPDSLAEMRDDARRERLLDMQVRLRPYRTACFAILALALVSASSEVGWWWLVPLGAGFAGFVVADRFLHNSSHPSLWAATAWGILPMLLADAVVTTGGGESPVLMWFALPAVTLGARF
jgi:fatty acid desaturase